MPNLKNKPPLSDSAVLLLSFFGIGFIPKAPGTFGSLATLPILYFLGTLKIPFVLYIPFILFVTIMACYLAQIVQVKYQIHDPGWIVLDEVLGMFVTWFFIYKYNLLTLTVAFVLFRFFDIIKVWPANWIDRQNHGAATILDDIVSAIYAGTLIFIFQKLFY